MKKLIYIIPAVLLSGSLAQSQEASTPALQTQVETAPARSPIDDHPHYFGLRAQGNIAGPALSYSYRISDHWLIGIMGFGGYESGRDSEGGNLKAGQYYKESNRADLRHIEANATIYLRDAGFRRRGWVVRPGIGYAYGTLKALWDRYDEDPAFFRIFGDKRWREGGEVVSDFNSVYARVGGYYQFVWARNLPGSVGGHILELGISTIRYLRERNLSYVRPDGTVQNVEMGQSSGTVDVAYQLVF